MIWIFHFVMISLLLIISKIIKKDEFFINSSFIYSLYIFGQRWMTGTDFPNYLEYTLLDFQVREPIYKMLQNFIVNNNLYFGILIFVIFAITLFNNFRFIVKIDRNVILIIYVYLLSEIFFAQLSQIRQFIAISFFINAYFNAYENKYGKSILNVLLGTGFHTSILFLVPLLFIKINVTRIKALYLLLVSAVLPLIDITLILRIPFFSRYSHYLESVYNVNLSVFHLMKFYALLLIVFIYICNLKKYRETSIDQMLLNGIVFNMLIYGLSFQFAPMIRINAFFKFFEFSFLIYYLKEIDNFSRIIKNTVVASFFLVNYLGVIYTDPYHITDYQIRHLRLREDKTVQQLWQEINDYPY